MKKLFTTTSIFILTVLFSSSSFSQISGSLYYGAPNVLSGGIILTDDYVGEIYATEADILNVALFGITASEWRSKNVSEKGNIRDFASIEQLVVLSNLESFYTNPKSSYLKMGCCKKDSCI